MRPNSWAEKKLLEVHFYGKESLIVFRTNPSLRKTKTESLPRRKQLSVLFVFSQLAAKVSVGLAVGSRKRNLVDPRGVEPLSENPLGRLSSWAVCYEVLPGGAQTDTRHRTGSPFLDDRLKDETPMHLPC